MAASGARICLLALGAPKQEILAARGFARHPQLGFLSIGAGLDFIAGHQTRAPVWVRKSGDGVAVADAQQPQTPGAPIPGLRLGFAIAGGESPGHTEIGPMRLQVTPGFAQAAPRTWHPDDAIGDTLV